MATIKEQFAQALKGKNWPLAEAILLEYFNTQVDKNPLLLKEMYLMREEIGAEKYKFKFADLYRENAALAEKSYKLLGGDLFSLLPPKKPTLPKKKEIDWGNIDSYSQILAPFILDDEKRESLFGIIHTDTFIAATDAYSLFFYPENKTNNKGIYCATTKCYKYHPKGIVEYAFIYDIKGIIPPVEEALHNTILSAKKLFNVCQLLDNTGLILSDNFSSPTIGFRTKKLENTIYLQLPQLKRCLKAFLDQGIDDIVVFFNGLQRGVCFYAKNGFSIEASSRFKLPFILVMPVDLKNLETAFALIQIDVDNSTLGMTISPPETHTKIEGLVTYNPIQSAIESYRIAVEFATGADKKSLLTAIEALETALEFA